MYIRLGNLAIVYLDTSSLIMWPHLKSTSLTSRPSDQAAILGSIHRKKNPVVNLFLYPWPLFLFPTFTQSLLDCSFDKLVSMVLFKLYIFVVEP